MVHYVLDPDTITNLSKNKRATIPHAKCIPLHNRQISSNSWCYISLVYNLQVSLGNAWTAFSRDFITSGYIDYVDDIVGQLPTEVCS
nr:hypothetical protein Iba_chr14fCG5370 [Ipomoea batatas]